MEKYAFSHFFSVRTDIRRGGASDEQKLENAFFPTTTTKKKNVQIVNKKYFPDWDLNIL